MSFCSTLSDRKNTLITEGQDEWKASDLLTLVDSLATLLQGAGIVKGDKIVLKASNGVEHFVAFLVCEKLALLYVPVYNDLTASEYLNIKAELGQHREIIFDKHAWTFEISNSNATATGKFENNLNGCLFKTSGTTGKQNYIFHSFENIWINAGIAAKGQNLSSDSKVLSLLTYSHMGGFCMQALPALRAGAQIIIENSRNYAVVAQHLSSVSHSILVPSMFRFVNEYCRNQKIKFSNRPLIITGSVPVSNLILKQMLELNFNIQVIYGLTEMGPYVSRYELSSVNDLKPHEFYLGMPLSEYEIKLEISTGEILLHGPCKGQAYNLSTGTTMDLLHIDSWLKTEDAAVEIGGELYFAGRFSQVINVGGFKVSPQEIESVILGIPMVEACVVVGEKHFALGEIPVAYVKGKNLDVDIINQKIHDSLARHKWPRKINLVESLPETSIGKIKKIIQG